MKQNMLTIDIFDRITPTEEQKKKMLDEIQVALRENTSPKARRPRLRPVIITVIAVIMFSTAALAAYFAYDYDVFQRHFGEDLSGLQEYLITDAGQGENEYFRITIRSMLADESFGVLTLSVEALTEESQEWLAENSDLEFGVICRSYDNKHWRSSSSSITEEIEGDGVEHTRYYEVCYETSVSTNQDYSSRDSTLILTLNLYDSPFSPPVGDDAVGFGGGYVFSVMRLEVELAKPTASSIKYQAETGGPDKLTVRLSRLGLTVGRYLTADTREAVEEAGENALSLEPLNITVHFTDGTALKQQIMVNGISYGFGYDKYPNGNIPDDINITEEPPDYHTAQFSGSVFFDEPIDTSEVTAVTIDGVRYIP